MTATRAPSPLAATAALWTLLLAACGGGGDGAAPAPPPAADTQALSTVRAVFDFARATAFLSNDVQSIVSFAPFLVSRGDLVERCEQGGSLQTTVLRNAGHADGPLLRQQFNDCYTMGIWIAGTIEVSYSRSTTDAPHEPWAGSVRFMDYRIGSPGASGRQRSYDGLATGEGSLGGGGVLIPERRITLTDFTLRDSPDTLGRGALVSTTARFELQRAPGAIGDPYTLQGSWVQQAAGLRVVLTLAAGSRLSMVQNVADETALGSIAWVDTTVPSFNAGFVLRPSGRTAVRLELDLGSDGRVDRDMVLDRYTQIGVGI